MNSKISSFSCLSSFPLWNLSIFSVSWIGSVGDTFLVVSTMGGSSLFSNVSFLFSMIGVGSISIFGGVEESNSVFFIGSSGRMILVGSKMIGCSETIGCFPVTISFCFSDSLFASFFFSIIFSHGLP